MALPARRRRTQPSMCPPPAEPPDPPGPPEAPAEDPATEMVTCFLSGARIPKDKAVLARLGPGRVMWMARELTSQG